MRRHWPPLMLSAILLLVLPGLAAAQSEPVQPPADPAPAGDRIEVPGSGSLSERLEATEGVIEPPAPMVDEGIVQEPPPTGSRMPVIPPPGTPGGDETIRPQ